MIYTTTQTLFCFSPSVLMRGYAGQRASACKRFVKQIVQDEGHMGSEIQAGLATPVADLDCYELTQR